MILYEQEIKDGISANSNTIAYTSSISVHDTKPDITTLTIEPPAKANLTDWDLFTFYSVLASTGWNKNDDVFDPQEMWAAKDTAVNKKVNFEHNEKDIIGHITSSIILNSDGIIATTNPPENFDVAVSAALYKVWEDPALQDRMNNLINEIAENKWFVSMECMFNNFDYAVITPGNEQRIIKRSAATSFLTKHLRIYGGDGEYEGYKIGRLLRNFTFIGKGLVRNPANDRSIIFSFNSSKATEIFMPNPEDLQSQLTKAQAQIEHLQTELKSKIEAAQKEEKEKLEKEIAKRDISVSELKTEVEKYKTSLAEKESAYDVLEKAKKALDSELAEAKKSLDQVKKDKMSAERKSKMVKCGLSEAEVNEIVSKWESASDEQFETIVTLYSKTKSEDVTPDVEAAEVEETTDVTEVPEVEDKTEALTKAFASWFKLNMKEKVR